MTFLYYPFPAKQNYDPKVVGEEIPYFKPTFKRNMLIIRFNRIQNEQVHKVLKAKELGNALDNPSSSNDGRRIF
jgi:hypothetical protein